MAVQAATCGVVPYQVVQVVAQLALAAAESAIDLQNMNVGLKVPIVKTKDTWTLSVNGLTSTVKDCAISTAKEAINEGLSQAAVQIQNAISDLSNLTAENVDDFISDLGTDLKNATIAKGEELLDAYFAKLQNKLEDKINELKSMTFDSIGDAKAAIEQKFDELTTEATNFDIGIEGCDDIKNALKDEAKTKMSGWLGDVETAFKQGINNAGDDITGAIIKAGNDAKPV